MLVANGHHWNPRYPEPPFPGQETFTGQAIHAHHYREPDERFRDRNVLVLGIGNSATDIAVETSRHSRDHLPGHAPGRPRGAQVHRRRAHGRAGGQADEPPAARAHQPDARAAG